MDPVVAKAFVTDTLNVKLVSHKSAQFLNKIIRAFFEMVPYQNISTSILPAEERFPTEQVVLENCISRKGGLGVHTNWFFKMLLEALGYNVEFLPGRIESPPSRTPRKLGSHFAILVKDLVQPGDLHLVDVGTSYPIFEAVPLNQLPYTATEILVTYRIVDEDGQWHGDTKDSDRETWTRFVSYDKTPTNENPGDVFRGPVEDFLKEDWLIRGINAVHYPQPMSRLIPGWTDFNPSFNYMMRLKNNMFISKHTRGFWYEMEIAQDQLVENIRWIFPNIPEADLEKKVQAFAEESLLYRCGLSYIFGKLHNLLH